METTQTQIDPKGLYSPSQVAQWVGCSRQNIHLLFALNRLPHTKIQNVGLRPTYFVTGQAVLDYLSARQARPIRKDGRRQWKETRNETRKETRL